MPKSVPNFQRFFLGNAKGNFYILLSYKKSYIIHDIIVIHMVCICIVPKNCVILHFYTSCHIKGKCTRFLFFENFVLSLKMKKQKDLVSIRH